jgi:hypothetical protein
VGDGMNFFRRSNCHLRAWEHFRSQRAEFMCIRFTEYSKVTWTQKWYWMPMRGLGMLIQWFAWPLTHLGEMLRTGRWYHATWIRWDREHLEFVPVNKKVIRWFPPILFHGMEKHIDAKDEQ